MALTGFAARIRKAFRAYEDRIEKDLTESEFGELVGATQQSVNRWFAGTRPDHERMEALARVLGVDAGWLAYGAGGEEIVPAAIQQEPPEGGSRSETGIDSDTTENSVPDPRSAQKRRRGNG